MEPAQAPSGWKSQRHLRNYLLDRGYQLPFTLTIVGISAVLTGGLGWGLMFKAHEASRLVSLQGLDDEAAKYVAQQFAQSDRMLMGILIAFGLVLGLVLFSFGIVLTHKVAGPLYKISLYLDKIREGKLQPVADLRKGDQLLDFFAHFKSAHDALRQREEEDIALLDRAIAATGSMPIASELRAARDKKRTALD